MTQVTFESPWWKAPNVTFVKNLLMPLFLMGCFPMDFHEAKRPPRIASCFPPGRKRPKKGQKIQNSPSRSDPQQSGESAPKKRKNDSENSFFKFLQFSRISGVGPGGGEVCNFSHFSSPLRRGNGPLRPWWWLEFQSAA